MGISDYNLLINMGALRVRKRTSSNYRNVIAVTHCKKKSKNVSPINASLLDIR